MEVEVNKLSANERFSFKKLIKLFEEVFKMEDFILPSEEYLKKLLAKPDFMVFIASSEEKIIGGVTVYTLEQYYHTKPLAYIYDLAVSISFQRKGIGRQLINAVNNHCREQGFEEVFVQADKIDDYAIDFYRKTKPTNEEDVSHFYYTLN
ncbi:MAG: GNAT family N-acetyltransferase [Bacteroidota bacterium]